VLDHELEVFEGWWVRSYADCVYLSLAVAMDGLYPIQSLDSNFNILQHSTLTRGLLIPSHDRA